jgi:GTP pyrophosphokinase
MDLLSVLREKNYSEEDLNKIGIAKDFNLQKSINIDYFMNLSNAVMAEIDLGIEPILALLYQKAYETKEYREEIEALIDPVTLKIVKGLVKIPKLQKKTSQIETDEFRNLLISLVQDIRVILIKIIENYYLITNLTEREQLVKVSNEAKYIYAPLAHRLGLYRIKTLLEDFSLKYLQPKLYTDIAKKINARKKERDEYIETFVTSVKEKLDNKLPKFEIKWRTKSIASIYNKIKKSDVEFEEIFDLYAARIIIDTEVDEKSECWKAYSIVTDMYQPNPARLRDWLSIPKSNGYESLHTTVLGKDNKWVEVQIRTARMNEIAEKGLAAHWKYKGGTEQQLDSLINNVREILENPVSSSKELIHEIQYDNMDNEIYIFTPTGDLKTLKPKSTVLDFAYLIHSRVGSSCIGAKIKNKIVPIKHILQNGDQVEILTSKTQKPKADWLKIVVTSKARSKIKNELNVEKNENAKIAKEQVVRRLKNWKIDYSEELMYEIIKEFGFKTTIDFFYAIYQNKFDVLKIKYYIDKKEEKEEETKAGQASHSAEEFHFKKEEKQDVLVIENNLSNIDYSFAKCCKPVFGDEVFGFTTIAKGVKIHRANCPNAKDMKEKFPYRIMEVAWSSKDTQQTFQTSIKIIGDDQIGLIGTITALIQREHNIQIRSMNVNSNHGVFEAVLTIFVKNKDQINFVCNKLQSVKGVTKVDRLG